MNKIAFILPGPRREPVGGYKVIYQYADYLSNNNYLVDIIYLSSDSVCKNKFHGIKGSLKYFILFFLKFYKWYDFSSKKIKHKIQKKIQKKQISNYKLVICSSVESFIYINNLQQGNNSNLLYFVQDYENWNLSEEELHKTYSYKDLSYITISDDLKKKISLYGGNVSLTLYNGIQKKDFFITTPWKNRKRSSFLFMYHPSERKGCSTLLASIKAILNANIDISFSCFSAYPKPKGFPKEIEFHYRPEKHKLNKLYNDHRFFICSSIYEGFGLTPAEAAFAGSIIVTTKNGGVEQYVQNELSGFIIENNNIESFIEKILELKKMESNLNSFSMNAHNMIVNKLNLDSNFICLEEFIAKKIKDY